MAESLSVLDVDDQHCDLCVAGWARLHRFSFEHIAWRRPPLLIARLVQEKISCVFMHFYYCTGSGLVTTILVARFWVLVVPTLVMRILLSLVMSSVGLAMFTAAIIRTAIAVMLRFDGTERQYRTDCKGCDSEIPHCFAP